MALFRGHSLEDYLNFLKRNLADAVEKIARPALKSSSVESLAVSVCERFRVATPTLGQPEVDQPDEALKSDSQRVTVHVPFEGDPTLFQVSLRTAPAFFHVDPTVRDHEIVIVYDVNKNRPGEFIEQLTEDVGRIAEALKGVEERVAHHNAELLAHTTNLIEQHKARLAKQEAFADQLGALIPIRRRDDGTERIIRVAAQ